MSSSKFPRIADIVVRLPVGTPEEEVVAYVKSRLKKGFWATMSEEDQCAFVCEIKRAYAENLQLHSDVTRGRF
jgi:hypothetical protein